MKHLALTEMVFRWSPETLTNSLLITGKGMLGIFSVILLIWFSIVLLRRAFRSEKTGTK